MGTEEFFVFPAIDPVIFELGPLSVRWYGMMYLVGFIAAYLLAGRRLSQTNWTKEQLGDLLFWGFLGVILGGRIGYVLFLSLYTSGAAVGRICFGSRCPRFV